MPDAARTPSGRRRAARTFLAALLAGLAVGSIAAVDLARHGNAPSGSVLATNGTVIVQN